MQDVFAILDYMSRWVQEKKRVLAQTRVIAAKHGQPANELEDAKDEAQVTSVEKVMSSIPANIIAQRAIECGSYARALFHWEHFIREQSNTPSVAT